MASMTIEIHELILLFTLIFPYHGTTPKRGGPGDTQNEGSTGLKPIWFVVSPAVIEPSDLSLLKVRSVWSLSIASGSLSLATSIARHTQPSEGRGFPASGERLCFEESRSTFQKGTSIGHYSSGYMDMTKCGN